MHKPHLLGLMLVTGALSALASCDYYWNQNVCEGGCLCYSDPDSCQSNGCTWDGASCVEGYYPDAGVYPYPYPNPPGPDGPPSCTYNPQCPPGWYCDSGTCVVTSLCSSNNYWCPSGFDCDLGRSSCIPPCTSNADCTPGETCTSGVCGAPAPPSCGGTITCTTAQPTCPSGDVPTIANGCWTGNCEAIKSCDVPPACAVINDEQDCLTRTDCTAVYNGIDCTMPDGSACKSGDTNCTCASYVFASCQSKS